MKVVQAGERIAQRLGLSALQALHDVVDLLTLLGELLVQHAENGLQHGGLRQHSVDLFGEGIGAFRMPSRLVDGIVQSGRESLDRPLRMRGLLFRLAEHFTKLILCELEGLDVTPGDV